jgi:hypothetical protein
LIYERPAIDPGGCGPDLITPPANLAGRVRHQSVFLPDGFHGARWLVEPLV